MNQKMLTAYGTEHFGRLKQVLLHRPVKALQLINRDNFKEYLFDRVPDVDHYLEEHCRYEDLLKAEGVEVFLLQNLVEENRSLMERLPNLAYLHDTAVISRYGAILSKMCFDGRKGEEIVVKEGLTNLGIPIFFEFDQDDAFEGCLLLSPETVFIALTERHREASVRKLLPRVLKHFKEVIYVEIPRERRFMHPDMLFNRVGENLALVYLPAILSSYLITRDNAYEIDFEDYMERKGIELIGICEEEQRNWGCTFVPLEPNRILHYDIALNDITKKLLQKHGVEVVEFHPDALLAGGGSLRCLTLRLYRE